MHGGGAHRQRHHERRAIHLRLPLFVLAASRLLRPGCAGSKDFEFGSSERCVSLFDSAFFICVAQANSIPRDSVCFPLFSRFQTRIDGEKTPTLESLTRTLHNRRTELLLIILFIGGTMLSVGRWLGASAAETHAQRN